MTSKYNHAVVVVAVRMPGPRLMFYNGKGQWNCTTEGAKRYTQEAAETIAADIGASSLHIPKWD